MGKVLSVVQRKIKRINVENRAHRIISKDKPTPAPMHPSAKEQLDKVLKEHPEIVTEHQQKDPSLHNRLKDVFVTSENFPLAVQTSDISQNLPQSRHTPQDSEFGFYEPGMIPHGRVTLRQALKFISDHQSDPKTWTIDAISKEYNISKMVTEKVLEHFHTFQVYIPEQKGDEKQPKFAQSIRKKLY